MRVLAGCLTAIALAGCGGSTPSALDSPPPPGIPANSVTISDFTFSPGTLTVTMGTTVHWTNNGPSSHSVTSDSSAFDSGTLSGPMGDPYGGMTAGGTFTHIFSSAGTFDYHCAIHAGMHGTITVTP
jgi:plastocyanin